MIVRRIAVCLALFAVPATSHASTLEFGQRGRLAPAEGDAQADRDRAAALYKQGKSRFELFDFGGAIELWSEAYGLVPEGDPDAHAVRSALVHNLSVAHVKAYDVDEDVTHLRTSKMLLSRYLETARAMDDGSDESTADITTSEKSLAEVEAKLTEYEARAAPKPDPAPSPADRDGGETKTDPEHPKPDPGVPAPTYVKPTPGKPMVIAGAVILGLGAAAGAVGGVGAAMGNGAERRAIDAQAADRPEELQAGRSANTLAYVGAISGGALLVVGAVILAIGAKKNASVKGSAAVRVTPLLGPTSAGVRMRF